LQEKDVKRVKERKETKKGRKEKNIKKEKTILWNVAETEVNEKRYFKWRDERLSLEREKKTDTVT